MRNGLTKTLAAVAIACLGYQAFALAPVIRNIPSPVVTDDANPVTGVNQYVFVDFPGIAGSNLNSFVTDDGPLANIIWSYTSSTIPGRYEINGAGKLNLLTDSTVTPPSGKVINSQANITNFNEINTDGDPLTPTIRDISISPFNGGGNTGPNAAAAASAAAGTVLGSETITLFASDGTTVSLGKNLIIWTQKSNTGVGDRLSATPTPAPARAATLNFATGTNNWVTGSALGPVSYSSTGGLCMTLTALGSGSTGASIAQWVSPYGSNGGIVLTDNSVYRIRATMSTNQTTPGLVPLWGMLVQNLNTDINGATLAGDNAYTGDYEFLDNIGSANAIKGPAAGINQFDVWYAPSPVSAPQWRSATTGAFSATNAPNKDMRLVLRVLAAGGAGYLGELDSGQICMTNLVIDRFDLSLMFGQTDVYNLNPIVSGINGVSNDTLIARLAPGTPGSGSNVDFTTNPLTISPADPLGWITELNIITPGDTNNPDLSSSSYGNGSASVDNFPVTWLPNTLYMTSVVASAPTVADEAHGPDSLLIGYEAHTIELFGSSYILTGLGGCGMPKAQTSVTPNGPQTYLQFFWSHNGTASSTPEANRLRYKIQILSTDQYNRPTATDVRNTGAIRIHQIKVSKVSFFGMN